MRNKQEMREMTCCFTGHREIPNQERKKIFANLEETVVGLINKGYLYFGAGGARGFDALAAQAVLKLRAQYPAVKLILVLPCRTQTKGWSAGEVKEYERIKAQADKVVYIAQEYTPGCMHKRNRHLVDSSGVCVCYLTRNSGGTAYTVNYAKENGVEIINIAP